MNFSPAEGRLACVIQYGMVFKHENVGLMQVASGTDNATYIGRYPSVC